MLCSIDLDVKDDDEEFEYDDYSEWELKYDDSEDDDFDYLWSFLYTWLKFVAGSWMDGGATSLEVSVLKILISVFHNCFAFYLFSFNIAISLNSKYVTSVCDNSTFLVPLHFMLSATQDNKQIIYLMCVFYFFIFLIDNVFFHFFSWTRDKYLYNFFLVIIYY